MQQAVATELRLNAQRTHLLRLFGVSFFFALFIVLTQVQGDASWSTDFVALGAYWLGAVACFVLARRSEVAATWLAIAPAALDMPFVYLVQRANLASTPVPGAVAGFTLGVFVLLLILSMLSLTHWQVVLAAVVGAGLEVALQYEAGVSVGGMISAVAVMAVAGALAAYSGQRLRALLVVASRSEKLAALGQLSAAVGHDLRNPLSAVTGALFVLKRRLEKSGPLDEKAREALELAERELRASQRIIEDLLDFAREQPLERVDTELAPLVDEAVSLVRKRAEVSVTVQVPTGLRVPLARDRFRQVLVNLVQNACEAIPLERAGQVTVATVVERAQVTLTVTDDGAGIDAETRARLFEPLFTTKKEGTGLGLAIVASLVKQHGGSIEVESTPGRGSTFRVQLPQKPVG